MGVSKNNGTPKLDGENNGKPYFLMDDLGGKPPIFGNIHMDWIEENGLQHFWVQLLRRQRQGSLGELFLKGVEGPIWRGSNLERTIWKFRSVIKVLVFICLNFFPLLIPSHLPTLSFSLQMAWNQIHPTCYPIAVFWVHVNRDEIFVTSNHTVWLVWEWF